MRLQKSATYKRHNDFINEMIIREMTSKNLLVCKKMILVSKRIIRCNPSMTVFITHEHHIVSWELRKTRVWESVKTGVWESIKTRSWCMSSHISFHGIACRIPT